MQTLFRNSVTKRDSADLNPTIEMWLGDAWPTGADAGSVQEGEWHHLAFVWTGDQVTTYVNGERKNTVANDVFNFDATLDPELGFALGRPLFDQFGNAPDAIFDDVSVWDGALGAAQIAELVNGASPLNIIPLSPSDVDLDGDVDGADFLILQRLDPASIPQWEIDFAAAVSGVESAAAVPEPTALAMALLGGAGLALAARRRTLN